MSAENVATSRRGVEAFNRGDLDAWLADLDPEIAWYAYPDEPDPGPFRHTAGSDAAVVVDEVYLHKYRDGRIVEVREYRTREEALEAVARGSGRRRGPWHSP
jgi:ketosteroid isomerase-like protein